ncbi:MAG: RNA 2',3'-cyclic phosphodiesterase [Gammaproteobacteria bacterium]|nr:RNA 2',3'-cyclic phosphodiesterase [Gammaproteobacteria bacterium]
MSSKRIYFALWPDERQRERLRDVINSVAKTVEGRAIDRRDWHVTLVYIGDFPADQVPALLEGASLIQVEPFRLSFDRMEFWPRPKIACMVVATVPPELDVLIADLNTLLQDFGVLPEDRAFRPHITVARNARTFTTERLTQRAITEWSSFELVESVSGPGGVRYRPLKQ